MQEFTDFEYLQRKSIEIRVDCWKKTWETSATKYLFLNNIFHELSRTEK